MSPVTHAMSRVPPLLPALRQSSPLGPAEVCPQRALGPRRQGRAPRSEGQGQKALLKREKPQDGVAEASGRRRLECVRETRPVRSRVCGRQRAARFMLAAS